MDTLISGDLIMQRIIRTGARLTALGMAAVVAACGRENRARPASSDTTTRSSTATPASGMGGMAGMPGGMHGVMQGGSMIMMDSMAVQMTRMEHMTPAQMQATMPMHRQMTANMMVQMTNEMRSMNMGTSPEWDATIDSIRQDLVRMPDMSARELKDFMPAHQERVQRLMDMHRTMMSGMKQ